MISPNQLLKTYEWLANAMIKFTTWFKKINEEWFLFNETKNETVGIFLKSIRKIVERSKIDTSSTQIYD
jgi:hypothetical protein